jgi:hypothetical protein
MNPLLNRINDQLLHPLKERLSDQQKVLREKGTDLLSELQERQEKLFDRGQRALSHFEQTVLERTIELLNWAWTRTGKRSVALKKTADFVSDRLAELREAEDAGDEEGPLFDSDELEGIEVPPAERKAEKKREKTKASIAPPFDNYDHLNVKKLAARFNDLDREALLQARAYEEATKARKTVFEAIDRLLE